MSKKVFRRRKIVIDRGFQIGMSMKITFALASYLILFYLMAVFAPFLVMVVSGKAQTALIAAERQIVAFVSNLLLPLVLTFACMALHCILMSHRVAGPVYRLRKCLESMRDGDLTAEVRLRDGDYLTNLAESYNDMIVSLRADVDTLKQEAQGIVLAMEAAARNPRARAEVRERVDQLCVLLDAYRTSAEPAEEEEERAGAATRESAEEEQAFSQA